MKTADLLCVDFLTDTSAGHSSVKGNYLDSFLFFILNYVMNIFTWKGSAVGKDRGGIDQRTPETSDKGRVQINR